MIDKEDFVYRECDVPRTEQIERFMKMSQQERDALREKLLEEVRKEREEQRERNK